MPTCENTLCGIKFDWDDVDACVFCNKQKGVCPECLEAHETVCAEQENLEDDYSNDPRNER
jgi:hypothetical protein